MSPIPFLAKARGTRNLVSRIGTILNRFSVFPGKYEDLLRRFGAVTGDLGCVPTFPITAVTLKRHPAVVRELSRQGVEFAVHGYIHTDYGVLPRDEQARHYRRAVDTFEKCGVPYTGFRAPFVRINDDTFPALSDVGFRYDSSFVVNWDVLDRKNYPGHSWAEYERILEFYESHDAGRNAVLPRSYDGFVEIPVSMPDDEIMVERLGVTDGETIGAVWTAILEASYGSGELFTLQLHPERIVLCEDALGAVVRKVAEYNPPVWIATLREIAGWWQERAGFTFSVSPGNEGEYRINTNCTERATILTKNCELVVPAADWYGGYRRVTPGGFTLQSPVRPVIGVHPDTAADALRFLRSEGYIVEPGARPDDCAIYLDNLARFSKAGEKLLSRKIEESAAPLVRYWRWPDGARSALSITGDIDSITLQDFALRILENWRQKRRK